MRNGVVGSNGELPPAIRKIEMPPGAPRDEHGFRGSGRTTAQMKAAPQNATFVWCNEHFMYARRLALAAGRPDLHVVPVSEIYDGAHRLRGQRQVVVDHATKLKRPDLDRLLDINDSRPERQFIFFSAADPKIVRALLEAQELMAPPVPPS